MKVNVMLTKRKLGALRYEATRLRKVADEMDYLSKSLGESKMRNKSPYPYRVPYPLRAMCLTLDFVPFTFWWPSYTNRNKEITEAAKADARTIWWFRFAWFQISYRRML